MNRLEILIKDLCPDGVQFYKLQDIASVSRGKRVTKKDLSHDGKYPVYQNSLSPLGFYDQYNYPANTPFVICAGAAGEIGFSDSYYWGADDCFSILCEGAIDSRYLYHFLLKEQKHLKNNVRTASIPRLSQSVICNLIVPVPPLEVQNEIVRILDRFLVLVTRLTSELTRELAVRKQQYEYYRRHFLENYDKHSQIAPISTLGTWKGGKTPSMRERRFWENGTIPWISSKDMKVPVLSDTEDHITDEALSDASMYLLPEESVAIVTRSGILKHTLPVAYVPFRTTVNQDIKALTVATDVSARYVSIALQTYGEDIRIIAKKQGGTVDSLDFQKVLDFKIPLPTYEAQLQIVKWMDNYESIYLGLHNDLVDEVETRRQQYEYYRDKLLTFNEL